MTDRTLLSISEVAAKTGLQTSALRYYETAGLIASQTRIGGRRHYSPSVLQRLATVALLQEAGFTVAEIAEMIRRKNRRRHWKGLAERKLAEIEAHLQRVEAARELLTAALACDCSDLESCGLVDQRRGRHQKVVQTLSLRMRPSDDGPSPISNDN